MDRYFYNFDKYMYKAEKSTCPKKKKKYMYKANKYAMKFNHAMFKYEMGSKTMKRKSITEAEDYNSVNFSVSSYMNTFQTPVENAITIQKKLDNFKIQLDSTRALDRLRPRSIMGSDEDGVSGSAVNSICVNFWHGIGININTDLQIQSALDDAIVRYFSDVNTIINSLPPDNIIQKYVLGEYERDISSAMRTPSGAGHELKVRIENLEGTSSALFKCMHNYFYQQWDNARRGISVPELPTWIESFTSFDSTSITPWKLLLVETINIIKYVCTSEFIWSGVDEGGDDEPPRRRIKQARRPRRRQFDYNIDGCSDMKASQDSQGKWNTENAVFIKDTLHDFYAKKGVWSGLNSRIGAFPQHLHSEISKKPSTNDILNLNLLDSTQNCYITFVKTSYKKTLCSLVPETKRQKSSERMKASEMTKLCEFEKYEDNQIRTLFQDYQHFSLDCGSPKFFGGLWNTPKENWIPISENNVLSTRFDPSPSSGNSKRPELGRVNNIGPNFKDLEFLIVNNQYTLITNQNPDTNDILQMIELSSSNGQNVAINFITNASLETQADPDLYIQPETINITGLKDKLRTLNFADPAKNISLLNKNRTVDGNNMVYNTYYINGNQILDETGKNIRLATQGGFSIHDITTLITYGAQAAGPGSDAQTLNRVLNAIVPGTGNSVDNKRFLCALELKRLGDWGQIENIKYVNECITAPTDPISTSISKPFLFVTCDKIAAHIAMCYNVPTFASFDRSESNTLAGKIVKLIKKIGSRFKTFCLFTPPINPAQKIPGVMQLYNLQFAAYAKSLNILIESDKNLNIPMSVEEEMQQSDVSAMMISSLDTTVKDANKIWNSIICESYLCNNGWFNFFLKDQSLFFPPQSGVQQQEFQVDVERINNLIKDKCATYSDVAKINICAEVSPVFENFLLAIINMQPLMGIIENSTERARAITYLIAPSILKILIMRNEFFVNTINKLDAIVQKLNEQVKPFKDAAKEQRQLRRNRNVSMLKMEIDNTFETFEEDLLKTKEMFTDIINKISLEQILSNFFGVDLSSFIENPEIALTAGLRSMIPGIENCRKIIEYLKITYTNDIDSIVVS